MWKWNKKLNERGEVKDFRAIRAWSKIIGKNDKMLAVVEAIERLWLESFKSDVYHYGGSYLGVSVLTYGKDSHGAGEMTQWLKMLTALTQGQSSVPSIYTTKWTVTPDPGDMTPFYGQCTYLRVEGYLADINLMHDLDTEENF